ncbi:MAG: HAD family hydrolase [Syntrophomonadaceae bacterium]|jgi:P-type E1-E2 ATPase
MIQIAIPGRNWNLELENLLLDLNGTLSTDGTLLDGVKPRVSILKEKLNVYLLTADTLGSGARIAEELGIPFHQVSPENGGADKHRFLQSINATKTAAIGNGFNDTEMLAEAALSIAVIGSEGCCIQALMKSDIVVTDIVEALEMLVNPLRIIATLRA